MQFKVIGSNSAGNGYLLVSKTGTLLIECGLNIKKIKHALNFTLTNISAIVSHSHGDHAKSIKDVMDVGIPTYASIQTLEAKNVAGHHRAKILEDGKITTIGEFRVRPFPVIHDVHCFGFMISHPEMGTAVFITDTCYSTHVFQGVNHFIIECNHAEDILERGSKEFLKNRIRESHMNLDTCTELLLANDLSQVHHIILIHLSNTNSDEKRFQNVIESKTGKTVTIADAGLIINNFNKQPF